MLDDVEEPLDEVALTVGRGGVHWEPRLLRAVAFGLVEIGMNGTSARDISFGEKIVRSKSIFQEDGIVMSGRSMSSSLSGCKHF
jgi:hypothetical protein